MSKLRWVEGYTSAKEFVKNMATVITLGDDDSYWDLIYPEKAADITDLAIIGVKPFVKDDKGENTGIDTEFYLKIERPMRNTPTEDGENYYLNYVNLTIGDKLNDDKSDLDLKHCGIPVKYSWYRDYENVEGLYFGDWLPVQYFMNIDDKAINLVVQGDPSIDVRPNKNSLFSYVYVGAIDSYEGGDSDTKGNFGITAGSHESPVRSLKFGANTGTGVLDIVMAYTRSGAPYQAHTLKFKADNPYMDKYFIGPSEWTHKFHFDEPTVVHKYDRERGKLRNVLIGDRSALENNAELIYGKGTDDQRVYKCYQINSPYWFVEGSANPLYGVVLRKE